MTPQQKKMRAALERAYLADLRERTQRASCPRCGAKPRKPCIHDSGPRRGLTMAGSHTDRAAEANRRSYVNVRGPRYWAHRR